MRHWLIITISSLALIAGALVVVMNKSILVIAQPAVSCTTNNDCPSYAPICGSNGRCVEAPPTPTARPFATANFAVNTQAIGACLISIRPTWGYVGTSTALTGKQFGSAGAVEFTNNTNGYSAANHAPNWSWNGTTIAGALVPTDASTGRVRVSPAGRNPSNELAFTVRGTGNNNGDNPEQCIGNTVCVSDNQCPTPFTNGCAIFNRPNACCQVRPIVTAASPPHDSTNTCLNAAVELTFNVALDHNQAISDQIVLLQHQSGSNWDTIPAARSATGNTLVVTQPNCAAWRAGDTYKVVLKGGENGDPLSLRSRLGVSMYCNSTWAFGNRGECYGVDYVLRFTADPAGSLCTVNQVNVVPPLARIAITESTQFNAVGHSSGGQAICLSQVNWSIPNNGANVIGAPVAGTSLFNITAGTNTGTSTVQASVAIPNNNVTGQGTVVVTAGAPRVADDSSCSDNQSPAPRPNRADVCSNSKIQVRFSMFMDQSTLDLSVKDCGTTSAFDHANCLTNVRGTLTKADQQINFAPDTILTRNTWYQAIVPGTARSTAVLGNQLLSNLNYDSDNNGSNDAYAWHFRTRDSNDQCRVEAISINPNQYTFTSRGQTHDFTSSAINRQYCAVVNPSGNWSWSLDHPSPVDVVGMTPNTGDITTVTANKTGSAALVSRLSSFSGQATANLSVVLPNPLTVNTPTGGNCRNDVILLTFTSVLDASTVNNSNIKLQSCQQVNFNDCVDWTDVAVAISSYTDTHRQTVVTLTPTALLAATDFYRVLIKGQASGVKDIYGQQLQHDNTDPPVFNSEEIFNLTTTLPREICRINTVVISRHGSPITQDSFLCAGANNCSGDDAISTAAADAGNQHIFTAQAKAANGDAVTANYNWSTAPTGSNLVTLTPAAGAQTRVTASNQNGSVNLIVEASNNDPQYGRARGSVGLRLFLCQNPWPAVYNNPSDPSDLHNGYWEPFIDNDTGFSFYYCRDDGSPATTTDDLPALPAPIRRVHTGTDLFRELIFLPGSQAATVTAGNNAPYFDIVPNVTAYEYDNIRFMVYAHDPENDSVILSLAAGSTLPAGAQFVDQGDGTGQFSWQPNGSQGGNVLGQSIDYPLIFKARDSGGEVGQSNPMVITVRDHSGVEAPPEPPRNVNVVMAPDGPTNATAAVTWNMSSGASSYRVFRRDDGSIQGGGSNGGYIPPTSNNFKPTLKWVWQIVPKTIAQWLKALLMPLTQVLEAPLAYASTNPPGQGAYIQQGTVQNSSCSGGSCSFNDSQVPVLHHLCYAIKACNNTGCSVFSAPACADSPAPNHPPQISFINPASSPVRLRPNTPFTFRAQISESDVNDYIKSYEWSIDNTVVVRQNDGNYGQNINAVLTRSFAEGSFGVSLKAKDSNNVWSTATVQADVQPNNGPDACIINPIGPQPPWCTNP